MIAAKLDEDLSEDLVGLFQAHGFNVTSVRLQGWTGWPDGQVFDGVRKEGRWLFTADKGFSDIRTYAPGTHHGIVVFRAQRESRAAYLRLATQLMDAVDLASVPGALVIVSERGIRTVRPPPPAAE